MTTEEASAKRNYYVNQGHMQVSARWETSGYFLMASDRDYEPDAVQIS